MSFALGEAVIKGAAGGIASFVAGKIVAPLLVPYAWSLVESTASQGKEIATSALKASGVALAAFAIAGAGYGAACWAHQRTDTQREGYNLILAGHNPETVENLHRYVPALTFAASLTPLAYLTIRLIF